MIRIIRGEEDLRWYYAGDFLGPMGVGSNMGGITARLQLGVSFVQSKPSEGISEDGLKASERRRKVRAQLARCSGDQQRFLSATFTPMSGEPLTNLGAYSYAVLASDAMERAHSGDDKAEWLRRLVKRAGYVAGKAPVPIKAANRKGQRESLRAASAAAKDRAEAKSLMEALRLAAEQQLAMAIRAYGGTVEMRAPVAPVSLGRIARALGCAPTTIAARVARLGLETVPGPRGARMVRGEDLEGGWTEAAEALAE